jgi:hypothetical protein
VDAAIPPHGRHRSRRPSGTALPGVRWRRDGVGVSREDEFDERLPPRLPAHPRDWCPRTQPTVAWQGRNPPGLCVPPAHRSYGRDHRRTIPIRPAKLRDDLSRWFAGREPSFRLATKHRPRIRPRSVTLRVHCLNPPDVRRQCVAFADGQRSGRHLRGGETGCELPAPASLQEPFVAVGLTQPDGKSVRQMVQHPGAAPAMSANRTRRHEPEIRKGPTLRPGTPGRRPRRRLRCMPRRRLRRSPSMRIPAHAPTSRQAPHPRMTKPPCPEHLMRRSVLHPGVTALRAGVPKASQHSLTE